jgi:hypothetical protein
VNAFTSLLVRRQGPVDDVTVRELLPDLSFMEPAGLADYHQHVEYRNAIAHGKMWGDAAGWRSVAAGLSAKLV